jgi:hypothetical protein
MPYKSKAEEERDRWMTLPEAVAHIRSADHCDENAARQEIMKALADGVRVLGPLRWKKEKSDKPAPFGSAPITTPTDTPPIGSNWLGATIRWKNGRVRDDWSEHKNGKWRVLLILRSKVEQYWPLTPAAAATSKAPVLKHRNQLKQTRARPEVDRAARALKVLYPDGNVPDQPSVHNKALLGMVNDCLARMTPALRPVKMDSCLRAADRRLGHRRI